MSEHELSYLIDPEEAPRSDAPQFSEDDLTDSESYRLRNRTPVQPPRDIEEKHQQMNSLFGIRPFKASVLDRPLEMHSETVQQLYAKPTTPTVQEPSAWYSFTAIGNYCWVLLCGWWMFLVYAIVGIILFATIVGKDYGKLCLALAKYFLWPFGKVITSSGYHNLGESEAMLKKKRSKFPVKLSTCGFGCILWSLFAWSILVITNVVSFLICWGLVLFIPMAKVMQVVIVEILFSPDPLSIEVSSGYPDTEANVVVWTFAAANKNYYKYTAFGVNVVLLNLFPLVLLALFFSYVPYLFPVLKLPDMLMFVICLFSVIPLAYYIGLALSSLSAQTSFTIGAVLNATFGSIIELILYVAALVNGLGNVVQASITGTLLALMLFLPGLSMLLGGIRNKDMKFNPVSAGVSGVLLLISVLGTFTPTIYYQIYGHFVLTCAPCTIEGGVQVCRECEWQPGDLQEDPIFTDSARHLTYFVAAILPLSYFVGLIFTLKTHAHVVDDPAFIDKQAAEEHVPLGPKWSKLKCIIILLACTLMFGLVSEEIVHTLEPTLELIGISEAFAGLTIIAVVSYTAEFVNAIQFAIHNNFSMSLEIANSAAVQVALIQVPVLIFFSIFFTPAEGTPFTMIFPVFDVFTVLLAVIIMNYISIEGKANYFLGFSLLVCYALLICAYFYVPSGEEGEEHTDYDISADKVVNYY